MRWSRSRVNKELEIQILQICPDWREMLLRVSPGLIVELHFQSPDIVTDCCYYCCLINRDKIPEHIDCWQLVITRRCLIVNIVSLLHCMTALCHSVSAPLRLVFLASEGEGKLPFFTPWLHILRPVGSSRPGRFLCWPLNVDHEESWEWTVSSVLTPRPLDVLTCCCRHHLDTQIWMSSNFRV